MVDIQELVFHTFIVMLRHLPLMSHRRKNNPRTALIAVPLFFLGISVSGEIAAQTWTGSLGVAYLWQDSGGNENSFRSQTDLEGGFDLEDLRIKFAGDEDDVVSRFQIDAWGFGGANPTQLARLHLGLRTGVSLDFKYDRRSSFFGLAGEDLADRNSEWDITRIEGRLVVDSWKPVRFSLIYRTIERAGFSLRPTYGLNERYLLDVDLDETLSETALRIETRTLPVRLIFEQSLTDLDRRNRPSVGAGESLGDPVDPDLFGDTSSDVRTRMNSVPTTRLIATYADSRFEGAASVLWRSSDLDVYGTSSRTYLIAGGGAGTLEFIDGLSNSARRDVFFGTLSLGFALAPRWTLRFDGDYRDGAGDSKALVRRLIRATSPDGNVVEYSGSFDDSGVFDLTDSSALLSVEYHGDAWSFKAGGGTLAREVDWRLTNDGDAVDTTRSATNFLAGFTWSPGRHLDLTLDYDHGSFDDPIFRIDPETIDRTTLKIRSHLGNGWYLDVHGRYVTATNGPAEADLDRTRTPWGIAGSWTSNDGSSNVGITFDRYSLDTKTTLVVPGGNPSVSTYDLDLTTTTIHGATRSDLVGFSGSLTYLKDTGTTWPVDSWTGNLRFTLYGPRHLEYSVIVQYWSYDEGLTSVDDFDVTRYGLALTWRFQ